MSYLEDIQKFSESFKNILLLMKEIFTKRELAKENLAYLKARYSTMVKSNTKKIFLYCLDSFFYQYKIYSTELEQIESSRKMVNNRMYCEYFKLSKIIVDYLDEIQLSYEDKKAFIKVCPVYKDLDLTIEYDMNDIENIYNNIVLLLNHLNEQSIKNISDIESYNDKIIQPRNSSFSPISNFVNTLRNENLILQGQIELFMNYLSFFLSSQEKQLLRINERTTNFLAELDDKSDRDASFMEPVEESVEEPIEQPIEEKKDSPQLEMSFE